jgi:hypothetical protein
MHVALMWTLLALCYYNRISKFYLDAKLWTSRPCLELSSCLTSACHIDDIEGGSTHERVLYSASAAMRLCSAKISGRCSERTRRARHSGSAEPDGFACTDVAASESPAFGGFLVVSCW